MQLWGLPPFFTCVVKNDTQAQTLITGQNNKCKSSENIFCEGKDSRTRLQGSQVRLRTAEPNRPHSSCTLSPKIFQIGKVSEGKKKEREREREKEKEKEKERERERMCVCACV